MIIESYIVKIKSCPTSTKKSKNYNKPKSENSSQPGYPDVMVEFGQENESGDLFNKRD